MVRKDRAGKISPPTLKGIERYLAYHRQKAALKKGFGAWKDENHPDLNTPEDSTAYVRRIRETG